MTRGNQRDQARAKNLKKEQEKSKGRAEDNLTPQQRRERDGAALAEKAKRKAEAAGGGAS